MDGVMCMVTGGACPKYSEDMGDFDGFIECPIGRYEVDPIPAGYYSYDLWCLNATAFPGELHTQTH